MANSRGTAKKGPYSDYHKNHTILSSRVFKDCSDVGNAFYVIIRRKMNENSKFCVNSKKKKKKKKTYREAIRRRYNKCKTDDPWVLDLHVTLICSFVVLFVRLVQRVEREGKSERCQKSQQVTCHLPK